MLINYYTYKVSRQLHNAESISLDLKEKHAKKIIKVQISTNEATKFEVS